MTDSYRGKCSYDRVKYLIGVQGSSVLDVCWLICLLGTTLLAFPLLCTLPHSLTPNIYRFFFFPFLTLPFTLVFSLSVFSFLFLTHSSSVFYFSPCEMLIEILTGVFNSGRYADLMWDICSYLQTRDI